MSLPQSAPASSPPPQPELPERVSAAFGKLAATATKGPRKNNFLEVPVVSR